MAGDLYLHHGECLQTSGALSVIQHAALVNTGHNTDHGLWHTLEGTALLCKPLHDNEIQLGSIRFYLKSWALQERLQVITNI